MINPTLGTADPADYQVLTAGAGLVDFSGRTQIELRGDDRAKFLHSFCTNEVRRLPVGAGCEAFILNVQGKILGHVLVFCGPEALVLETVPGEAARLLAHLDRYLIREQVTLRDLGPDRAEWLLAGPAAPQVLATAGAVHIPTEPMSSVVVAIGSQEAWLRRVQLAGPASFLIDGERGAHAGIGAALVVAGATRVGEAAWQTRRIESGWPLYGVDITDKNLPQELDRDRLAINFTKGCYLGQETVARIDALGHVNKTLVGVRFQTNEVPAAGTELSIGDQVVGQVTSACFSPRLQAPLALAYVRRGQNEPGMSIVAGTNPAEVVRLPLPEARSS